MVAADRLESLLNEYKGNFFEYLVGLQLVRAHGSELEFLHTLSAEMISMLEQQEEFMRRFAPQLLQALPKLAQDAVEILDTTYNFPQGTTISVVGKIGQSKAIADLAETDLLVEYQQKKLLLSIKLAKHGSFVNTKSAGMRSFFTKYFNEQDLQDNFNEFCDEAYERFAIAMHLEAGLEYTGGFKTWEEHNLESLPGKLAEPFKPYLLDYYREVNEVLHQNLLRLLEADKTDFMAKLYPLLGFSRSDVVKLVCHYAIKEDSFIPKDIKLYRAEIDTKEPRLIKKSNNIEVVLGDKTLQLRLKPMNKFTSKAFKINCSVKDVNPLS